MTETKTSFARGPGAYILIILLAAVGAYVYSVHKEYVFACPATGYGPDTYLAYCNAPHFGDYDHGAFWFDLEPPSRASASAADVVFLGNSRMEFAFATDATVQWFASTPARYYLLGFAYWENYLFERPLLEKLKPHPKAYVISLESFFENKETPPAQMVMHDPTAEDHYRLKRRWEIFHQLICTPLSALCGNEQAFFRSRSTGGYVLHGGRVGNFISTYKQTVDQDRVLEYTQRAKVFLATLPADKKCILLTIVPSIDTDVATAQAIAKMLGLPFVAPQIEGLSTFDKSHMDKASAERWSQAFFQMAGPMLQQCLGESDSDNSSAATP